MHTTSQFCFHFSIRIKGIMKYTTYVNWNLLSNLMLRFLLYFHSCKFILKFQLFIYIWGSEFCWSIANAEIAFFISNCVESSLLTLNTTMFMDFLFSVPIYRQISSACNCSCFTGFVFFILIFHWGKLNMFFCLFSYFLNSYVFLNIFRKNFSALQMTSRRAFSVDVFVCGVTFSSLTLKWDFVFK